LGLLIKFALVNHTHQRAWRAGIEVRLSFMLLLCFSSQSVLALDSVSRNVLRLAGFFEEEKQAVQELGWDSVPQEVNLRGEVEDLNVNFIQQGLRNSCAAFSATSMLELQLRRLGMNIDLSEQYVLWATTRFGADPSMGLTTLQLTRALVTHKICSEELMPYRSGDKILEPSDEALAQAAAMPGIRRVDVLPQGGSMGLSGEDIFAICQRLAQYQPVCLSARWAEDGGTLSRDFVLQDTRTAFYHMVLVIGYELAPDNPMAGHFLIRNSWGLRWGDFGYAKIPFSYVQKYGVDALAFEFHWDEERTGEVDGADELKQLAAKFPAFLSMHGGIAFLALLAGLAASTRVFGTHEMGVRGIVRFSILCVCLYFSLARLSSVALAHGAEGLEKDFLLPMAGFLGVAVAMVGVTMRNFGLNVARALGFLLLMLLVWNGVFLGVSSVIPVAWYADWKDATATAVAEDYLALGMSPTDQRADFLRYSKSSNDDQGPAATDVHLERFKLWESSLLADRSRMQESNPVAAKYFSRRMEAYNKQFAAYKARHSGSVSAALPEDRGRVWQMYQELQAEREVLDRADARAVQAFNEKAEAYQNLKTRLEANESAN